MNILEAFVKGVSRVGSIKRIGLWMLLFSVLLAAAPALLVGRQMAQFLGKSGQAEKLVEGYDDVWYQEFQVEAASFASTFHPTMLGEGAVLRAVDDFLSGRMFRRFPGITALGLAYLLLWIAASGGVLHLFEREQAPRLEHCSMGAAAYFWRFLRLAILVGIGYWLVFSRILPALGDAVEYLTREAVSERIVFFWTAGKYLVVTILLLELNLLSDYAKVATVCEGRRSMILALIRAFRLQLESFARVWGLYLLLLAAGGVVLLFYLLIAPGAGQQSWTAVLAALTVSQIFLAGRIFIRLLFLGSHWEMGSWLLESKEMAQQQETL